MRKRTVALLLVTAMAISMTACGTKSAADDTKENTAETDADNASDQSAEQEELSSEDESLSAESEGSGQLNGTLAEIDAANRIDQLLAEYGSITLNYENAQDNSNRTVYVSEDCFMDMNSDGSVLIDEDMIYGRDSENENDYYKLVCMSDEDYEAFQEAYETVPWYTSDLLTNDAEIQEDGDTLVVTVQENVTDGEKDALAQTYKTEAEDIAGYEYRLEVDAETMVIQRIVASLNCGSTGIMISDTEAEFGADQPDIPGEITDFLNATDVRTFTVVVDPGTENESTYEDTIRKGCAYRMVAINYGIYTDKECTSEYTQTGDLNQDLTLYLKSK